MVSYYCATDTLSGPAVFSNSNSFTCTPGWSAVNPQGSFSSAVTGTYLYILGYSTNAFVMWPTSGSTISSISAGTTSSGGASNTFQLTCTGY